MKFDPEAMVKMDSKSRMKEFMRCPALLVGCSRLDYLREVASGFDMCVDLIRLHCNGLPLNEAGNAHLLSDWNYDWELQHWMLTKHSAIIRHAASLNGWSLFERYFSTGTQALAEFSRYLHRMTRIF